MDPGDESFLAFASFDFLRGLRDADGRPLGERKAPPAVWEQVETDVVACDYADALADGAIAGYAADVFELEDHQYADRRTSIDARLLQSDQTLFTPHIGTATAEDRARLAITQAQSVLDVIDGRRPGTAVNDPVPGKA